MADNNVVGKVVLITGAASGIGLAIAKEFKNNGIKGISVVDMNEQAGKLAVEQLGKTAIFIKTDVTSLQQYENAFKTTIETFGSLDIVINNAGIADEKQWSLMMDINTTAVVNGTHLGLKYMGKNHGYHGGVIVNTSSIYGIQPNPISPIYTGSKYFVMGFVRAMGTPFYFDTYKVRILAVCPGVTKTNLINTISLDSERFDNIQQYADEFLKKIPLQTAENVARGFLATIKKGNNGSTWIVENDTEAYEIHSQIPAVK